MSNSYGGGNSVYFTNGLPKNFDSREKWPYCPSIGHIYNQGNCRSSYAIAAASAVSDRICIQSNGTKNPIMSAQHIISCCYLCGYGCDGGSLIESWDFYRRHGFVSGGDYNSNQVLTVYRSINLQQTIRIIIRVINTPHYIHYTIIHSVNIKLIIINL